MSIFSTTANTGFNSFSDPLNPMNMNGGGWGMDPNYLTPSYTAPYRPSYGGPQGYSYMNHPGFFRSANNLINPFAASAPMGVNPMAYNNASIDGLTYRPADAAAWGMQNVVAPAAAAYGAYKLGQLTTTRVGGAASFSGRMAGLWDHAWGGTGTIGGKAVTAADIMGGNVAGMTGSVATAMGRQGIFAATGAQLGRSTAGAFFSAADFATGGRLMSSGAGLAARGGFMEAASMAGGLAGGLLLPMAVAQGAVNLAQSTVFNPYIANRRTAMDLRENFSNITMGGYGADVITGRGLSRATAARISSSITKAGVKDRMFSEFDMSAISDLSARSGLLDNASIDQISGKVKDISKLVKLMMNLTNDPDLKNNIEAIVKLKNSGVSLSGIGGVMSSIGISSSIAGISTQRMMNTVGAQGQYLAQANGLTPYLGQVASANAMAGFASAYRTGLISPAVMSMMGGTEGATQSLVAGQINAGQTMYNRISMYNQYFGKGRGAGTVDNLSRFGAEFARNPLAVTGEMELNDGLMRSNQLKDEGPLAIQRQLMDMARNLHQGIGKDGRLDGRVAYALAVKSGMLTSDQARAFLERMDVAGNPKALAQQLGASKAANAEQITKILQQQGLHYGMFNGMADTVRTGWQALTGAGAEGTGRANISLGKLGDTIEHWYHNAVYGKDLFSKEEGFSTETGSSPTYRASLSVRGGQASLTSNKKFSYATIKEINKAASGAYGEEAARAANEYLSSSSHGQGKNSIADKAYSKLVGLKVVNNDDRAGAYNAMAASDVRAITGDTTPQSAKLSKLLGGMIGDRSSGRVSNVTKLMTIGLMDHLGALEKSDFIGKVADPDSLDDSDPYKASLQKLKKLYPNKTDTELYDMVSKVSDFGISKGLHPLASDLSKFGSSDAFLKDVTTNKSKYFDKATSAKFDKAMAGAKTDAQRKDIALQYWGKATNHTIRSDVPDYISGNMNASAKAAFMEQFEARQGYDNNLMQLAKEGKIDTSVALHSVAVDKMVTAIQNFGFYVEHFGDKALGRKLESVNSKD